MLPGTIMQLPVVVLLAFANVTQPSFDSEEEPQPRAPSPLQPAGRWSTASWEPCSNPCGAGEEQRQVSCVLEDVSGTLIVATDGFCAPPRPTGARPCYQYRSECANTWVTGDWGQCSAKCGGGQRSRVVECHAGRPADSAAAAVVPPAPAAPPAAPLAPLPDALCVPQLRPAERRDCNLHPCPDGRRVWLRTSDGWKPRRIRLFSKFTLRCPFHVFWTPADDRSKRKYAWYKDGRRLPIHEDKYTQTDSRGELRVKGADQPDSGVYTCASLTANPQGRSHNMTVMLERIPGEPTPTTPHLKAEEDADDSPEDVAEESGGGADPATAAPPHPPTLPTEWTPTTAKNASLSEVPSVEDVSDNSLALPPTTLGGKAEAEADKTTESAGAADTGTAAPVGVQEAEQLPVQQLLARRKRGLEATAVPTRPLLGVSVTEVPDKQAEDEEEVNTEAPDEDEDDDTEDPDEDEGGNSSSSPDVAIDVTAARYDTSEFSECSASCGRGVRQRAVRCINNESKAQLPLAACEDLGPPPPPQMYCNVHDCPPTWEWPSWSGIKCSRPCGGGAKWRQARCTQRFAQNRDETLEAARCAHLGPGEERRDCHKAACRAQLREGELLRLDCLTANATWRHDGRALRLEDTDKYLADAETGTLIVYGVLPGDAGLYLCDEDEGGGRTATHRFNVTVLPPMPLPDVGPGEDDLFIRVWNTADGAPPAMGAEVRNSVSNVEAEVEVVAEKPTEQPGPEAAATPAGPPFPWHRLFSPAAPLRGRVLGIFS